MTPVATVAPAGEGREVHKTDSLRLGNHVFLSRLIVGTGKYHSYEVMRERSISPAPSA